MKISTTMKRILLILGVIISVAAAQIVLGQAPEGVIEFESKANLHRTLPKDRPEMKNMLPEFRVSKQQLFFNTNESLYKPVEEDEDDEIESDGGGMRIRFKMPSIEIYSNQETTQRLTQQEFMGKMYLIEDTLNLSPWKFGTETKTIMGYECRQASYYSEERKQDIVAWYTMQLRGFLGPENFNTLPGAVLMVDINNGERVLTAKTLVARALKKNELKIPKEGTRTTRIEFRKMMEAQMEKMRANGANVMIRN
jgi:GLPGLI family protein